MRKIKLFWIIFIVSILSSLLIMKKSYNRQKHIDHNKYIKIDERSEIKHGGYTPSDETTAKLPTTVAQTRTSVEKIIAEPTKQSSEPLINTHLEAERSSEIRTKRKNVLFLMADDLRTQMQPYEGKDYLFKQPEMRTPNFQRLAAESLLLKNAFVQYSLCGPSRTSMLTSRRPDTLRVYDNKDYWRKVSRNYTTLPQYFKENGYVTICMGKIFHLGVTASNRSDPVSWTEPCYKPYNNDKALLTNGRWKAVSEDAIKQTPLIDILLAERAHAFIETMAPSVLKGEKQFFLAVGFRKPHSVQVCPKKFFEWYSMDNDTLSFSSEVERLQLHPETLKEHRRAYYSCISYVDSLLGDILDILERAKLKDSTVVIFSSDHGYHVGEHGWMGKSMMLDMATRVPLMIRVPGRTDHGIVSESIVEAIDLFPTIVEAVGLETVPSCGGDTEVELCTEGKSFLDLIDNPDLELKGEGYSQKLAGNRNQYSIRTPRFRLSQYTNNQRDIDGKGMMTEDMELYDHQTDFKEYHNVADLPKYYNVVRVLSAKLEKYVYGDKSP